MLVSKYRSHNGRKGRAQFSMPRGGGARERSGTLKKEKRLRNPTDWRYQVKLTSLNTRRETIYKGRALKRLLVPVDFSDCSREALAYAEKLAGGFGARITILNVVPLNEGVLRLGAKQFELLDQQLQENQRRKLAGFVRESTGSKPARCLVRLGDPVREIVRAAEELSATAIVISTHGLTGVKHALIGSVAEKVVRHARCPVWIVPARTGFHDVISVNGKARQ
jgi:nucleotide-binding universal stress UspA family protein